MTDPFKVKRRPNWKEDPNFKSFNERLYNEMWNFEKTLEVCKFDKYTFKGNRDEILKSMKEKWLKNIQEWNSVENINNSEETKGFCAMTFLFFVLPYGELDDVGKYFTTVESNMINIIYFYNTNGQYLNFEGTEELFNSGPMFPPAYQQWLDNKYNSASWWTSYMVYEKINGYEPLIDSAPAKLQNK
jgi:hypothetical protein